MYKKQLRPQGGPLLLDVVKQKQNVLMLYHLNLVVLKSRFRVIPDMIMYDNEDFVFCESWREPVTDFAGYLASFIIGRMSGSHIQQPGGY